MTLVKNLLAKKTEDKFATHVVEDNVAHNSAIGSGDYYPIMPRLPIGDQSYQRLGDSVKPKYLTVRGYVTIDRNHTPDNRPIAVDIYALTSKRGKDYVSAQNSWGADYLNFLECNDDGGAMKTRAYTGAHNDMLYKVNKRVVNVVGHKRIILHPYQITATAGATSIESAGKVVKVFTIKIKCPATLNFESDRADNLPTNFTPWLSVGYQYVDGGPPDLANTRIVMNAVSEFHYTDF